MKYRNYKDPLFYDKDANDRIFVPTSSEMDLTEDQRRLLESFPEEDRGLVPEGIPQLIPAQALDDPIEAAAIKAKMKQEKMREARRLRDQQQQPGYISKSVTIGGKAQPELDDEHRDD